MMLLLNNNDIFFFLQKKQRAAVIVVLGSDTERIKQRLFRHYGLVAVAAACLGFGRQWDRSRRRHRRDDCATAARHGE
jgi:hypothetical protein